MTSPTHRMRACWSRSTPAMSLVRSAIVDAVDNRAASCAAPGLRLFGSGGKQNRRSPPRSKGRGRRSAPGVGGGSAQPLDTIDTRIADTKEPVDIASLEEVDAERLAHGYRLFAVAPRHDGAGAAEAGDQLAELVAASLPAVAHHVPIPPDLSDINP